MATLDPAGPSVRTSLDRTASYVEFTSKNAIASFENLVALANHQERIREARRIIWRDRGEPAVELEDLWECIEHAARGGMRAGTIAFSVRACVNIVLATARFGKVSKHMRLALIRHAIFGEDSFRFAAMLGSFVTLYKAFLNSLPILFRVSTPPAPPSPFDDEDEDEIEPIVSTAHQVPFPERSARLSVNAQAHQVWIRKRTRRWHATVAGAIAGGLAVMFEKRSRRIVIAQQLFVRGLQGSYNHFTDKHGISIPYGDVMVFCLCCSQIVYALFYRSDTLPRSYTNWLKDASGAPKEAFTLQRDLDLKRTFKVQEVDAILNREALTPSNRTELLRLRSLASAAPELIPLYAPCSSVHPTVSSCAHVPLIRFSAVFKWAFPVYGALHFVPMILFKRHTFLKNPFSMFLRAGWSTARSAAFLSAFITFFQSWFCIKHWLHRVLTSMSKDPSSGFKLSQKVIDTLISKYSFALGGFVGALSLLVEERRRRGELAMYVLPKGLESAWVMARGKGWVFKTGDVGEMLLAAIGMGMVMRTYQNDPQHLSGLVRRILYQFIGPN